MVDCCIQVSNINWFIILKLDIVVIINSDYKLDILWKDVKDLLHYMS